MAIYRLEAKIVKRSAGQSATAAAAYRAGELIVDECSGKRFDYRNKSVTASTILAPSNAPLWARDRQRLWNEVEKSEKRKDARLAREILVSIPKEVDHKQIGMLLGKFVRTQFVQQGMIADVAFHNIGKHNPHAHILLTTRTINEKGFGQKDRSWNDKQRLLEWRKAWADMCNEFLDKDNQIDHRSLKDQGIDRKPEPKIGVASMAIHRKGLFSWRHNQIMAMRIAEDKRKQREKEELEMEKAAKQKKLKSRYQDSQQRQGDRKDLYQLEQVLRATNMELLKIQELNVKNITFMQFHDMLDTSMKERFDIKTLIKASNQPVEELQEYSPSSRDNSFSMFR